MVSVMPSGLVMALGAGGARGLAHIGVLQVLAEQGLRVRAVAGSSIGAEIGALYTHAGDPALLAEVALGVDWKQTLQLFLPDRVSGGLCSGRKIVEFLSDHLGDVCIENLATAFLAVATDLHTGEEVILTRGPVVSAVRASISLPGLLAPYSRDGRMLVDGGIVNPVPFDVARAIFGGPVVAVAVHQGARDLEIPMAGLARKRAWRSHLRALLAQARGYGTGAVREWLEDQLADPVSAGGAEWRARSVLTQAVNIAQAQVVRLRLRFARPDLYLTPDVDGIGPFEFYKAREAIAAGRAIALEHLAELHALARDAAESL